MMITKIIIHGYILCKILGRRGRGGGVKKRKEIGKGVISSTDFCVHLEFVFKGGSGGWKKINA